MLIYFILFYCFSALAILSSCLVVLSSNTVFSALFLVFSFCNVSCLIFLLHFDFLPITFLIVYVGAIAVLFLFVLMMLNIKLADLKYERLNYIPLVSVFALIFITETCMFLYSDYTSLTSTSVYQVYFLADFTQLNLFDSNFMSVFSSSTNMASLAQLLFNDFYTHFLIAGMILLLAMIAAIVSTLNKRFIAKSQIVYNQVLRSFDSSIVHF